MLCDTPHLVTELEYLAILNFTIAENVVLEVFVFTVVKRTIEL
jgi:hypothetical protein